MNGRKIIKRDKLEAPFTCPSCGEGILVAIPDRMAPHRAARFLRKLGLVLLLVNFLIFVYSILVLRNVTTTAPGPAAGLAILLQIAGPSLVLYALSLLFPTVRIDHCFKCGFHKEVSLWKETKIF